MKKIVAICIFICCFSCEYFQKPTQENPIARVGEHYLYEEDLASLLSENTTKQDSIIIVTNYINKWATERLLIDRAQINISLEKQKEFEQLVADYKNDLYAKAYKEALVKQSVDTIVSLIEEQNFYEENKENFKLNEELLKLKYISINPNNSNFKEIKERFQRFDADDKQILDSLAIQFNRYSLNDSIWVKATQVFQKIPSITIGNKEKYLKKSQFSQIEDSLEVYLVQIEDRLLRNDIAPLEYIRPTIKHIILNKRKLEFIKKLEKDITKDAIKRKQFEIYN